MTQSGHGFVTLPWGDGEYTFRLAWGAWAEIQEKCDCGPAELLDRILSRRWRANDLFEVVRLGLIGGGMSATDALIKARRYVQDRPLLESVPAAIQIVTAALLGPQDDAVPVGEQNAVKEPGLGKSLSPLSTETVQ